MKNIDLKEFTPTALKIAGKMGITLSTAILVSLTGTLFPTGAADAAAGPRDPDTLTIVDCLLPAQVRKLGQRMTYLAKRRPMQTTAGDCEIRGGEYVEFDRATYASALRVWLPQAEAGDAKAQTHVGEIYEKGLGLAPDYEVAAAWYQKAAEQGYSRAQINLGYLYESGLGVAADPKMALNWYRRASGLVDDDLMYVSTAQQQIDEMNVKLAAADDQTRQLKAQLDQSEARLSARRRSLQQAQQELTALRSEFDAAGNGPAAVADSNNDKQALASLRDELAAREQLIARQRESISALERQTESQREALTAKLANAEDADATLRQELAQARQLLADTQTELAGARAGYQAELDAMRADQAALESEKASAVAGRELRIRELAAQLSQRETDLLLKDREIADMETRLSAQNQRVAQIEAKRPEPTLRKIDARPEPAAEPLLSRERISREMDLGKYYALIIGNNRYSHLPSLATAVNDAHEVDQVLRRKYGYRSTLLIDATRGEILTALNDLRQKLNENDNLLIYYAGHGELDRKNLTGYWMPVDARPEDTTNWIPDDQITRQLNLMSARHIMVVADSCYSGAMTRNSGARLEAGRTLEAQLKRLKFLSKLPSRTVLTSGGEKPVLDNGGGEHSVFARSFIQVLKNNEQVLEGQELYRQLFDDVKDAAADLNVEQNPQYSGIADAGHLNGEFLFVPLG